MLEIKTETVRIVIIVLIKTPTIAGKKTWSHKYPFWKGNFTPDTTKINSKPSPDFWIFRGSWRFFFLIWSFNELKKKWTAYWRVLNMVGSAAAGNFSKCFQFWISAQEKPAKLFSNYFNSACYKLQFLLAINYNFCLELISLHWIQNRLFSIWESWNKSHSCCHVTKFLSCCHAMKVKLKKRRELRKMRI